MEGTPSTAGKEGRTRLDKLADQADRMDKAGPRPDDSVGPGVAEVGEITAREVKLEKLKGQEEVTSSPKVVKKGKKKRAGSSTEPARASTPPTTGHEEDPGPLPELQDEVPELGTTPLKRRDIEKDSPTAELQTAEPVLPQEHTTGMEEESEGVATPPAQEDSGDDDQEEEDAEEPAATSGGEDTSAGRGAPTPTE